MARVIGVKFRTTGKIYFFDSGDYEIRRGSFVIVETSRGKEYGKVVGLPSDLELAQIKKPLKPILRPASEEDRERDRINRQKEREAYRLARQKIRDHRLEMKLIEVEYTFDSNKILFYFTADERVDFRDLVRDLAALLHARIELRQIGVRDEARLLGGLGACGRILCCHSFLPDFAPVSIKMAKIQNLSLNPAKISGVCGRLMCCLKNEEEVYMEGNKKLPKVGDIVALREGGEGEVIGTNVLRESVRLLVEEEDGTKDYRTLKAEEVSFLRKKEKHRPAVSGGQAEEKKRAGEKAAASGEREKKPGRTKDKPQRKDQGNRPDRGGEHFIPQKRKSHGDYPKRGGTHRRPPEK